MFSKNKLNGSHFFIKRVMCIAFIFVLVFANNCFYISDSAVTTKKASAKKTSTIVAPDKGSLRAKSAILMDMSTGTILYSKNIHDKRYPASITKILTTYIACENCATSETVKFSKKAVNSVSWDTSRLWPFTQVNEKISMKDCLYAMMLASANEVCYGVGEHISGSNKNFANLMNQTVADLGLKDSHFANASGLHNSKHYTSAHDMACIMRAAMHNETFRNVTATKTYVMKKTNKTKKRDLVNHHSMISGYSFPSYQYKYCIGGKTGYTSQAGNTLVTVARKNGMELICVVMGDVSPESGSANEYSDTIKLFNYGFENFTVKKVSADDLSLSESLFTDYNEFFSDESPVKFLSQPYVIVPKGTKLNELQTDITYTPTDLVAGENVIGHVVYTYDGMQVGSTDIIYELSEKKVLQLSQTETTEEKGETKTAVTSFFDKVKNKFKFNFVDMQANVVNFLKTRTIFIIIFVLIIVLLYFVILRYREKKRLSGRNRFTKEEKENRNDEEGGFLNFSGKKSAYNRKSKSGASKSEESAKLNFSASSAKEKKGTTEKAPKESGLNFNSKKHTYEARRTSPYGMVTPKRSIFKKNRRYSWSDMSEGSSESANKAAPPNMNSKKNKKRHKKTISSFDRNLYN